MEEFLLWCEQRGVSLRSFGLEAFMFPQTGRGIRCTRTRSNDNPVISIPGDLLISLQTVENSSFGREAEFCAHTIEPNHVCKEKRMRQGD